VDSFTSEAGLVVPAVTAAQMREVDRVATAEVGPNLYQMMENAGQALAAFCMVTLGDEWTAAPVVVVVGTGGNGGGGMCAARHLANHGGDVTLVPAGAERLAGVPAEQLALYRAAGGRCVEPRSLEALQPALVVDALLGYNLTGEPYGVATDLIGWMADADAPVVSLDVPSGLNATTGDCPGAHVRAATTMTLALPKTGLHVDESRRALFGRHRHPAGCPRTRRRPDAAHETLFSGVPGPPHHRRRPSPRRTCFSATLERFRSVPQSAKPPGMIPIRGDEPT
jgi:NAD(P)H-hydrate epimerase